LATAHPHRHSRPGCQTHHAREWRHQIEDILAAITEIQTFASGATLEQFRADAKTLKAVAADLMIIGEAAKHVPEDVQEANQDVPSSVMRAMRNRVVHAYFDIDPDILWDTVQHDLPKLVQPLKGLLG
jgi:uncharacterized protein with HEPN domain